MADKPIGPAAHGAVDDPFAAANYLRSECNAYEPRAPLPAGQRLLATAKAAIAGEGEPVR